MDVELLSETLEALSDRKTASKLSKSIRPLKGIRGVPFSEVANITAAAWREDQVSLDHDERNLDQLFGAAFEDGLVAIGLLAAALPDDPSEAFAIGLDWLERVDDLLTADALGWLILGPGMLATGSGPAPLFARLAELSHPAASRAVMMSGMAMVATPIEGPSAAALRVKLNQKQVQFVGETLPEHLPALCDAFVRTEEPSVRKAVRRVLTAWAKTEPVSLAQWADTVRGGFHKMYKDAVVKARRKAAKLTASEDLS